jgi:hypothetical protein
MDDPVFDSSLEFNRVLAGSDDHLHRCGPHSSPTGCQNECGGIIEDGIKISYELKIMSYELKIKRYALCSMHRAAGGTNE